MIKLTKAEQKEPTQKTLGRLKIAIQQIHDEYTTERALVLLEKIQKEISKVQLKTGDPF